VTEDFSDVTLLLRAAKLGHEKRVRYFIEEKQLAPDVMDDNGLSPLHLAAQAGHSKVVRALLDLGAIANQVDKNGSTPLMYAMLGTNKEIASLLIEKGADPNTQDHQGQTPLMYACRGVSPIVCTVLLNQSSIDLDARDNEGMTALMHAASDGNTRLIRSLLNRGANPSLERISKVNNKVTVSEKASDLARRAGHYRLSALLCNAERQWNDRHLSRG